MPIVVSRLARDHVRTAVELAGGGVWLADAGGGWTMVWVEGDPGDQDAFSYRLLADLAELDPNTAAVLLWDADPDAGYLLMHHGRSDSHVWGVADDAAPHGDARLVARAVAAGSESQPVLRSLLSPATEPASARADSVYAFARAIGVDQPVADRALAGVRPVGQEFLVRTVGCHGVGVAGPLPDAPTLAQTIGGARWIPGALSTLAVLFGLGAVAEVALLATGNGGAVGSLGLVFFALLAVLCVAVLLGLRRKVR